MEKKHRVEVLRALLEMHQQQHEPDDEYIKGLRQRLKRRRHNLRTCGHEIRPHDIGTHLVKSHNGQTK